MSTTPGAVDGLSALRRIRCFSAVPILLITSGQDWQDRVLGLTLGADDCLSRPFRDEELLARIAAMLRRAPAAPIPPPIQVGGFELHPGSRQAYFRERFLDLTPTECQILELLLRQCGRTVSRDQITLHLYRRAISPLDRSIDTHVSRIRKKLGEAGRYIKSVRGTGYQLCAQADTNYAIDSPPAPPKTCAGEHR
jgi:DNA-binding response OmpR family regulator